MPIICMKIISRLNKKDKDIEDFYFLRFILEKVCISGWGKRKTGRTISFFLNSFIKIRERYRDIKGHINNNVILNFGKPKVTITSYC